MKNPLRFVILPCLLGCLTHLAVAQRIGVAVLNLEPQGVPAATSAVISELVRGELRKSDRLDLVERGRMEAVLREKAFQMTGCTESRCAVEAGEILNVNKMVIGTLGKLGKKYLLILRVVDVKTAAIDFQVEEKAVVSEEEIDKLVLPVAAKIAAKLTGQAVVEVKTTGGLSVNSDPAGATVLLDGKLSGQTPLQLTELGPGDHAVTLTKDGYIEFKQTVAIRAGQTPSLNARLERALGRLLVTSDPVGATVQLDGVKKGKTKYTGLGIDSLEPRAYRLEVSKVGYRPQQLQVTAQAGGEIKQDIGLRPRSFMFSFGNMGGGGSMLKGSFDVSGFGQMEYKCDVILSPYANVGLRLGRYVRTSVQFEYQFSKWNLKDVSSYVPISGTTTFNEDQWEIDGPCYSFGLGVSAAPGWVEPYLECRIGFGSATLKEQVQYTSYDPNTGGYSTNRQDLSYKGSQTAFRSSLGFKIRFGGVVSFNPSLQYTVTNITNIKLDSSTLTTSGGDASFKAQGLTVGACFEFTI